MAHVEDSFTTATAINPQRYPEIYKMLLAYPKGRAMVVPYYHRMQPDVDLRTTVVDVAWEEDPIHADLTKIHNLEMRLEDNLTFQIKEEDRSTEITGTAIMYPGMEPFVGDLFILELDNHQSTLMILTQVDVTTFRQERYYRVQFMAFSQLHKKLYERLEMRVKENCHFVKKKYFGESELTFLSDESFTNLRELEHYRKAIAQDIVNFFFVKDSQSFFRPDGIYDPYVTEFLRGKITVSEQKVRPLQLLVPFLNYNRSIWYKLTLAENTNDFGDLLSHALVVYKDPRHFTVDTNPLTGRYYLYLSEAAKDLSYPNSAVGTVGGAVSANSIKDVRYPHLINDTCAVKSHHPDRRMGYEFHYPECPICSSDGSGAKTEDGQAPIEYISAAFYAGVGIPDADTIEAILNVYMRTGKIDVYQILKLVKNYRRLGRTVDAYYRMAFYLEFLDAAIIAIK